LIPCSKTAGPRKQKKGSGPRKKGKKGSGPSIDTTPSPDLTPPSDTPPAEDPAKTDKTTADYLGDGKLAGQKSEGVSRSQKGSELSIDIQSG
jgi:hypothetical protein